MQRINDLAEAIKVNKCRKLHKVNFKNSKPETRKQNRLAKRRTIFNFSTNGCPNHPV
jgi:hypothetical protein